MHVFAKWAVVTASTSAVIAITTIVVLLVAGRTDSGWALATAWAVGVAIIPMGIGTWWVSRPSTSTEDSSSAPQSKETAARRVTQIAPNAVIIGSEHSVTGATIANAQLTFRTEGRD
jgi:hypothetical protein